MEPRTDDFDAVLIADFYNAPMLTTEQRAKRLRVSYNVLHTAQERLERRGIHDLRNLQRKIVSEVAQRFPLIPASELAKKLNASPILVGFILKQVESREQIDLRKANVNNSARSRKREERRNNRHAEIRKMLIDKPFATIRDVCFEFKCGERIVREILEKLEEEKYDRAFEREILLAEYVEAHPDSTKKDAAEHFRTSVNQIVLTKGSSALRNKPPAPKKEKNVVEKEDWSYDSEIDRDMESRLCIRPSWYVEEMHKRGHMGVELPEEEFRLYLEIRERRKRQGCQIFSRFHPNKK